MSATLNQVTLIGHLARDPELAQTPAGSVLCRMRVAVNEVFRDRRSGEERQVTTFLDVVAWGAVGENCGRFLAKGRQVLVCGRLYTEEWVDKASGKRRSMVKVRADRVGFLGPSGKETHPERTENGEQRTEGRAAPQRTENGEQRTEGRAAPQRTENGEQRTENRERRTENGEQRTENREQNAPAGRRAGPPYKGRIWRICRFDSPGGRCGGRLRPTVNGGLSRVDDQDAPLRGDGGGEGQASKLSKIVGMSRLFCVKGAKKGLTFAILVLRGRGGAPSGRANGTASRA